MLRRNTTETRLLSSFTALQGGNLKEDKAVHYVVHLVEDDEDDRFFTKKELLSCEKVSDVICHESAQHLFQYLDMNGAFERDTSEDTEQIILLDIHMPYMDGISALQQIKMHPLTEGFQVFILTGDESSKLAMDAYLAHANAYLLKPFRKEYFNELLDHQPHGRMKSR